jgi:cell division protein FtsQ
MMIEKSDVFVSIDGVLKAVVKQNPIARVMNGNNLYIDYEGGKCHYQIILQLEFHLFRGN